MMFPRAAQREAGLDLEVLDRVLDKGIVIDAWIRVSLVGIDLVTLNAHVVVASFETYLKYAHDPRLMAPGATPATTGATAERRAAGDADPLEVIHEAFEAWNGHDADRYAALLDDGFICQTHSLPAATCGHGAVRRAMRSYFEVFPDLHFTLEHAIATRDDVIVSWLATGTPRRGAGGRTAPLQVPGCTVGRLRHGKIAHAWNYWDSDKMLQRLGGALRRGSHGPQPPHRFARAS